MLIYLHRSIRKGLNLGLIDSIPVVSNKDKEGKTVIVDPLLQEIIKQQKSKFPPGKLLNPPQIGKHASPVIENKGIPIQQINILSLVKGTEWGPFAESTETLKEDRPSIRVYKGNEKQCIYKSTNNILI